MTDFWLSWLLLCSLFMFSVTLALMSPFPSGWPFLHGTLYMCFVLSIKDIYVTDNITRNRRNRECVWSKWWSSLCQVSGSPQAKQATQGQFASRKSLKNSIPLVPLESIPSINRLIISFMPLECYVVGEKRDNTISLRYKRLKDLHGWLVYNVVFFGLRRMVEEGRKDFHVWKIKVKSCQVERERERETRDHDQARCLSSRPAADIVPDIVFDV